MQRKWRTRMHACAVWVLSKPIQIKSYLRKLVSKSAKGGEECERRLEELESVEEMEQRFWEDPDDPAGEWLKQVLGQFDSFNVTGSAAELCFAWPRMNPHTFVNGSKVLAEVLKQIERETDQTRRESDAGKEKARAYLEEVMKTEVRQKAAAEAAAEAAAKACDEAQEKKETEQIVAEDKLSQRMGKRDNADWSASDLKDEDVWRPAGIPAHSREQFLSHADFAEIFKMTKQEFGKLQEWRRNALKKKHGLF